MKRLLNATAEFKRAAVSRVASGRFEDLAEEQFDRTLPLDQGHAPRHRMRALFESGISRSRARC
jgi:hypothetical protein